MVSKLLTQSHQIWIEFACEPKSKTDTHIRNWLMNRTTRPSRSDSHQLPPVSGYSPSNRDPLLVIPGFEPEAVYIRNMCPYHGATPPACTLLDHTGQSRGLQCKIICCSAQLYCIVGPCCDGLSDQEYTYI